MYVLNLVPGCVFQGQGAWPSVQATGALVLLACGCPSTCKAPRCTLLAPCSDTTHSGVRGRLADGACVAPGSAGCMRAAGCPGMLFESVHAASRMKPMHNSVLRALRLAAEAVTGAAQPKK